MCCRTQSVLLVLLQIWLAVQQAQQRSRVSDWWLTCGWVSRGLYLCSLSFPGWSRGWCSVQFLMWTGAGGRASSSSFSKAPTAMMSVLAAAPWGS